LKYLRFALLALGVTLLAALVVQNDPAAVLGSIVDLSWRLVIVLCFPVALVMLFDTLGWRFAFLREGVPFRALVAARLAGEAFNLTTPAALGGEAVKAWLLRGHAPLDASLASVIVAKTTITIAQGLFLLVGIVVAWRSVLNGSLLLYSMLWLLAIEAVALGLFVLVQTRGMFGWAGRLLDRLGVHAPRGRSTLGRVDDALGQFYRTAPPRLVLSIVFHFVAWLLGSLETWLILKFLGSDVSLATATVIEAFGTAVKVATFLIPASLGALEGGFLATFLALGLSPTTAISFSLVRRVREVVWIAIGLVLFAVMRPRAVAAS
jgi:glycosyltransferase 2 family protein